MNFGLSQSDKPGDFLADFEKNQLTGSFVMSFVSDNHKMSMPREMACEVQYSTVLPY